MNILGFEISRKNRGGTNIVSPHGRNVGGRIAYPNKQGYLSNVNEGYNKNPIVAACIGLYMSTLNEPPLVALNDDGELQPSHPLTLLFKSPNTRMGQAQFWQMVWMYLGLSGNCYLKKVRGGLNQVVELYPYSDAFVAPKLDNNGWIYAYTFQSGTTVEEWPASDVIHLVSPLYRDALKAYMGLSPIDVAWDKIATYNELSATIYSLAASNAVPSGILTAPGDIPSQQVTLLEQQLEKRKDAQGKAKTKPLILGSGMQYNQMGLDAQKLQATELFKELETAICGAFRIHPSVVLTSAGMAISTYANMETAYKEYTTLTRLPFWNSIEEQIEAGFKDEYGNSIQVEFDTQHVAALAADPDALIYPVLAQFNANTITQNEARGKMGYDPTDDGDKFSYEVIPAAPAFGAFADDVEPVEKVLTGEDGTKRIKWVEAEAVKYWKSNDDVVLKAEKELEPYIQEMFAEMQRQIMGSAKGQKKYNADVDIEVLLKQFMTATDGIRQTLLEQILQMATTSVGSDLTAVQSFMDDIKDKVTREVTEKMKTSLDTAKDQIAGILEANTGKPLSEITKALTDKFTTLSEGRAGTIARTVTKAQASATQEEAWDGMNKRETDPKRKIYKAWLTQRDAKVRDSHEKLDGKVITMGDEFANGLRAPGVGTTDDPSQVVNCRCVLRPVRGGSVR